MSEAELNPVFQCRQCGDCCQGRGGIFPTPRELDLMAQYLGMPVEQVRQEFLEHTPGGLAVKNKPGGGCVFNEAGRCRIHPVKPRICRAWPFLPAILLHDTEFEAAKEACPGLDREARHEDFLKWWRQKVV